MPPPAAGVTPTPGPADRPLTVPLLVSGPLANPWVGVFGLVAVLLRHGAFVEVSEKGTEAAAATTLRIDADEDGSPKLVPFTPTFQADRPFVFLVRDRRSGAVLFAGRVTNPTQPR